jgi:hypothetical protein
VTNSRKATGDVPSTKFSQLRAHSQSFCRFDATMFMDRQVTAKRDVGLIIALMDPKNPIPIQTEWEDWDAKFEKIITQDARQVFGEFQKIVTNFVSKEPKRCVAVFCEDGFNLTGYCIVSYIHQAYNVPVDKAVQAYADARSPGIFHKPYLDDLHELFGGSRATPPPPRPDWAPTSMSLVPPHGQFALPASRPRLAVQDSDTPKAPAPSTQSQLPAGWTEHWSKTHNKKYYFCKATGKQSWDFPTTPAPTQPAAAGLCLSVCPVYICLSVNTCLRVCVCLSACLLCVLHECL